MQCDVEHGEDGRIGVFAEKPNLFLLESWQTYSTLRKGWAGERLMQDICLGPCTNHGMTCCVGVSR